MSEVETTYQRRINFTPSIEKKRIGLILGNRCDGHFYFHEQSTGCQQRQYELTFDEVTQYILQLKESGAEELEFSGGEPIFRPDFPKIVAFARQAGIRRICVATNGRHFIQRCVFQELKSAGVTEFRFLLLGHNASIHDKLTQTTGSFRNVMQAIENCRQLELESKIKTVVTGLNHNFLVPLMEKVVQLKARHINFICLNPDFSTSRDQDSMHILYSLVAPKFQEIADNFWAVMKRLSFTFIPFCFMVGYEQYVNNGPQIIYDPEETEMQVESYFHLLPQHSALRNPMNFSFQSSFKEAFQVERHRFCREDVQKFYELKYKFKPAACRKCRYDLICDGVWRNYVKWVGEHEIQPVPGKKIEDPTYFMQVSKR